MSDTNHGKVVDAIANRVSATDSVTLDELIENTTKEYTNHWDVQSCFDVIDTTDCVSARDIGESARETELAHAGGDTTAEKEVRHWAAVGVTEQALNRLSGEVVAETVEM